MKDRLINALVMFLISTVTFVGGTFMDALGVKKKLEKAYKEQTKKLTENMTKVMGEKMTHYLQKQGSEYTKEVLMPELRQFVKSEVAEQVKALFKNKEQMTEEVKEQSKEAIKEKWLSVFKKDKDLPTPDEYQEALGQFAEKDADSGEVRIRALLEQEYGRIIEEKVLDLLPALIQEELDKLAKQK